MYSLKRTVDAATEPVTRAEAKLHLRVTGTDEDSLIDGIITAARQYFEDRTNRAVISQTLVYTINRFFATWEPKTYWLYLPRSPLATVSSIYYVATDGSSTLWDSANYTVDTYSEPGRVALGYGKTWPVTREQINAVTITYTAGWANAAAVPEGVKRAILLFIGDLYQNRETFTTGTIRTPLVEERFLTPWIVGDAYLDFNGVE